MTIPVNLRHAAAAGLAAALLAAACGEGGHTPTGARATLEREPWREPVPKAECAPGDPVETGLQGQVPLEDRLTGRSLSAYACNLERIGHHGGEGASWQLAWYDDCAYYGTARLSPTNVAAALPDPLPPVVHSLPRPGQLVPGVTVLDVADPAAPMLAGNLTTPAMIDPWESLKVSHERGLLAAAQDGGPVLDVYEVAGDCRQPELLASVEVADIQGHEGNFSVDGRTYWFSERSANLYCPIDLDDPTSPELIMCWPNPGTTHGMSTNADGSRGYFSNASGNGLVIGNTTQIQARAAEPDIPIVSELYWEDGQQAQQTLHITIDGSPYVLFVDELGKGAARIIDIADETAPALAGRLMLEVHDPANEDEVMKDVGSALFGYDGHYCNVDDPSDTRIVMCSYMESGLRVFDVRDPYAPREIAYWNPPATPGYHPGSNYNLSGLCNLVDWASAMPRYRADRGEIWLTSQCGGFHALRFTRPVAELLADG